MSDEKYIEQARELDIDDIAELLAERDELQNEVFTLHPMHNRIFQAESEQAQQRIHELESALLAIRGLVSMKASTMIHSFARGDVLRIIDKALNEDSD